MPEQGEAYAAFIEAELKYEYDRRTALDARGLAVVTSSAALLTVVFAVSALVTGKDFTVTDAAEWGVLASLGAFLVAGVLGILANRVRLYEVTHEDTLREMLQKHWRDDEVDARNVCAMRNVITIASLRRGNNRKASQITWALAFQVAAIAALAATLAGELIRTA